MKNSMKKSLTRGVLWGRIAGWTLVGLCLLAAVFLGLNATVSSGFNATADTLQNNIDAVNSADVDLEALVASQKQVTAQLDDASATSAVQLPSVRSTIADATETSRRLDDYIATLLEEQEAVQQGVSGDSSAGSDGGESDSASSDDADSAEDEEEQRKLEALLNQNATDSSDAGSGSDEESTTSPDSATTKPW